MSELNKLLIVLIIYILAVSIDITTTYKKCLKKTPTIIFSILLHRFISIFLYLGWIFNNKIVLVIYLLFIVGLLLHWVTNDWKCVLTQHENKTCNFSENQNYDIVHKFFNRKVAVVLSIILVITIITIVSMKLFKNLNNDRSKFQHP